ncbi:MAG TPA: YbaK/EbsC family protein [Streptosporangiaceae bacterium]|jgi:prolyl-tRNA editing enzyme YbaK/EbsC (Cys-tRNA(Pro) deacylase)
MHAKAVLVQRHLTELGEPGEVRELPDSTRSAAEAADAIGTTVAQIAKSLVFTRGEEVVLVIASGTNQVDLAKVGGLVGGEVTRPDAKAVKALTGFSVGGVPPLGYAEQPRTIVDRDLLAYDTVWAAAGTPHAVFPIAAERLAKVTDATIADIAYAV